MLIGFLMRINTSIVVFVYHVMSPGGSWRFYIIWPYVEVFDGGLFSYAIAHICATANMCAIVQLYYGFLIMCN
jgi:hypothetical protein